MSRSRIVARKHHNLVFKPLVIVLGEGECERSYINKIKTFALFANINIKFLIGDEENFETVLLENLDNIDNVLLILDIDNLNKKTKRYHKIAVLLASYPHQVFYNNYAFETWLLNHVETFGKPITHPSEYDPFFKYHFSIETWHKYKSEQNLTKILEAINEESTGTAIANIGVISKNTWDNNPSSNMDKFINVLINKSDM